MKIAVVILNWNGRPLLQQFVPIIVAHSKAADIYVVDNASTDDSVSFIQQQFPEVTLIHNNKNYGYAGGYNVALKQIKADVFCLINSDVEVTQGWLDPVMTLFDSEPGTAVVQPKIRDYNNKTYFEYAGAAGGFIDQLGYPYCRGRIFNTIEEDLGQYDDHASIFWASGACLFIRSANFHSLGGFDESFFAHMEEIDLCWRIQNTGFKVKFCSDSLVYHVGGATLDHQDPKKTYLNFRNSLSILVKNAKGNLIVILLPRLLMDGLAGLKFLLTLKLRHCMAVIYAHLSFYGRLNTLLKHRKSSKNRIVYFKIRSIVIRYFVNGKKRYKSL